MLRFQKLFEPTKIGRVEIKNRIVMSPMNTNYAGSDGSCTSLLTKYFEARAKGGVGLIVTGYSFIGGEPSRGASNQMGIHSDRIIPSLNNLVDNVHKYGCKIFIQLSYIGTKLKDQTDSEKRLQTSSIQLPDYYKPEEYDVEEIQTIIELFGRSAKRAVMAGFDGVEIAGTPGELPFFFSSKYINKRTDEFGRDFEGRIRFSLDILEEIRRVAGSDYPVGYRFCGEGDDYFPPGIRGFDIPTIIKIAHKLEDAGVDYLSILRAMVPMYVKKGVLRTAETVKSEVTIPVVAASSFVDPTIADRALIDGKADLIAFGRALIADPELATKTMRNREQDIYKCIRCNECIVRGLKYQLVKCAVNPRTGLEAEEEPQPTKKKKKIAVVGGGPAGLEASLIADSRGHDVTLFEMKKILGGNLIPGSRPDFKVDVRSLIEHFKTRLEESAVKVFTGEEVTSESLKDGRFDAVVLAIGSEIAPLGIPGENSKHVFPVTEVLNTPEIVRRKAIIIGGGDTGCETAAYLANRGVEVEIVEILEDILLEEDFEFNRIELKRMINELAIKTRVGTRVRRITQEGLEVADCKGQKEFLSTDSIVISAGLRPNAEEIERLKKPIKECYVIGDCLSPRKIYHAVHEGYEVGAMI